MTTANNLWFSAKTPYLLILKYYGFRLLIVSLIWFIYDVSLHVRTHLSCRRAASDSQRESTSNLPVPFTVLNGDIVDGPERTLEKDNEFWFDDGNIVLLAQSNIGFKVHGGLLARQSQVFADMLALSQPSSAGGTDPGVTETVPIYDQAVDVSNLLKAIYDGP